MNATETVLRAFERAADRELCEQDLLRAVDFGLTALLAKQPLRYLEYPGGDRMLGWWLAPLWTVAAKDLPYLRQEARCRWVLACAGYECVGFACLEVTRQNLAHLRHDFVRADWRGQGIGGELIRRRVELGQAANVSGYHATCNKASLKLYTRAGFREAGRRGSYIHVVRGNGL